MKNKDDKIAMENILQKQERLSGEMSERPRVLTAAVLRVSDKLAIANGELARILGLSPASVTRLRQGKLLLREGDKSYELGAMLVRLYRGLAAILGGDDISAQSWLRTSNTVLAAAPIEALKTVAGLVRTVNYVDARRAPL